MDRASYCLKGPENEASEILTSPLLRDQSRCKSFCQALSKIFSDPLYGKMERVSKSKDSYISRKLYTTILKSHSWSLSNGRRNPLPTSFSEYGTVDPVFSRDHCNQFTRNGGVHFHFNFRPPCSLQFHMMSMG